MIGRIMQILFKNLFNVIMLLKVSLFVIFIKIFWKSLVKGALRYQKINFITTSASSDYIIRVNTKFLLLLFLCIFLLSNAYGQQNGLYEAVGVNEKLGQNIPLDVTFYDEKGKEVKLRDLINKPTILSLVYYTCEHICPQVLRGLAELVTKLELVPGKDYSVITISFDDEDTPEIARERKINYIKSINKPFPEESWKFLTGNTESIKKLTDSVGVTFQKEIHGFIHPEVVMILSPEGKITRYFYVSKYLYGVAYPVNFSVFDFATALADASQGMISRGLKSSILYCFPHEPRTQEKFFSLLGIVGTITLLLLASLFAYLKITAKKGPTKGGHNFGK